jgi:hypothetical protein
MRIYSCKAESIGSTFYARCGAKERATRAPMPSEMSKPLGLAKVGARTRELTTAPCRERVKNGPPRITAAMVEEKRFPDTANLRPLLPQRNLSLDSCAGLGRPCRYY